MGNIGRVGQGPGEYRMTLYDDIIDDKNGLIYLVPLMWGNILVYNTSGVFLREIVAPMPLLKPKMFLSNDVLTILHKTLREDSPMAFQIDINTGQVLSELSTPAHFVVSGLDGEIFNARNVQGVFDFIHTGVDTLFHFDVENNRILPVFTMTGTEGTWRNNFQVNRDLIMTCVNVIDDNIGRLVSRGVVATDLRNLTSSYVNIVNDFFGNLPVPANSGTFRNGYFVWNIQPEELMDEIENHLARGNVSQNDRQQLEYLLSKLEENTNNVVFIGRLRDRVERRLW